MEQRYNIYFAGQLLQGHDLAAVRPRLAKLFNANEQVLDKLFSGNSQLLKKDCDKATALKYKQAMEKAGARPIIKAAADSVPAHQAAAADRTPSPTQEKKLTAAERIAALAAAADAGDSQPAAQAGSASQTSPASSAGEQQDGVGLAPAGSDVLRPEERAPQTSATIDTGDLAIDATAQRLSENPPPAPPAPDTSHLQMGGVGEDIPTLASTEAPLSPNTDALDLSPEGTDFSDCAPPDPEEPLLDLSGLDLAGAGSDVLEEQYRKREQATAPATDHLSLGD